jgi:hypothetical protein
LHSQKGDEEEEEKKEKRKERKKERKKKEEGIQATNFSHLSSQTSVGSVCSK